MDDKKKVYNNLLKRLLKGMEFLDDKNIPWQYKSKHVATWSDIKKDMELLLDEIGEIPKGGCLNEYE